MPMMPEIALNILDIAQNSIRAGASLVEITISVQNKQDRLLIRIKDNGCGMDAEQTEMVQDPFFTTRKTRKVGLGVPFFKQAAECTGGSFLIQSQVGKGTEVEAVFKLSSIDRMPLGDINSVLYTLIVFNQYTVDFVYTYEFDEKRFVLDTRQMKEILGEISFQTSEVSAFIKEYLSEQKTETDGGIEI